MSGLSNSTLIPGLTAAQIAATKATVNDIGNAKSIFLVAFSLILYDYLLNLSDEIKVLWRKTNTVSRVVLCLRYYSLFASAIICFGYFSPFVTGERCQQWMYFIPFGLIVPLMYVSGTLMSLRLYAIYDRSKIVLFVLLTSLIAQACVGIWIWSTPGAHPTFDPINDYRYHYCIFIPSATLGPHNPTIYAFMELSFDSLCFLLTLIRPFLGSYSRGRWGLPLWYNLAQNGALYFGVIFSVNLAWGLMIQYASSGVRGSLAAPSAMVMSTFIARITLSLRTSVYGVQEVSSGIGNQINTDRNFHPESHRLNIMKKQREDYPSYREITYGDMIKGGVRIDREVTISNN